LQDFALTLGLVVSFVEDTVAEQERDANTVRRPKCNDWHVRFEIPSRG